MAKTFDQLPLATTLTNADVAPIMQNGIAKKATFATIATKVQSILTNQIILNPLITQLTGGTFNSLDAYPTIDIAFGNVMLIVIGDSGSFWQLQSGAAGVNDVTPLDNHLARWNRILGL